MEIPVLRPDAENFNVSNAYFMACTSAQAYNHQAVYKAELGRWGFETLCCLDNMESDTQGFICSNQDALVLAFRGTEGKLSDWLTDLKLSRVAGPFGSEVHRGFWDALHSVWLDIKATLDEHWDRKQTIWVTGHSLGAALATLAVAKLIHEGYPVHGLYTFGSPRVGDSRFAKTMNEQFKKSYRFVNNEDLVTRIPRRLIGYRHIDEVYYFNNQGQLEVGATPWHRFVERMEAVFTLHDRPSDISDHSIRDKYVPLLLKQLERLKERSR